VPRFFTGSRGESKRLGPMRKGSYLCKKKCSRCQSVQEASKGKHQTYLTKDALDRRDLVGKGGGKKNAEKLLGSKKKKKPALKRNHFLARRGRRGLVAG